MSINTQRNPEGLPPPPLSENANQGHDRPTLPAEIIDLVVDHLANHTDRHTSHDALRSMSLAARGLSMSAHQHLFSTVHLTLVREESHIDAEKMHNLLKQFIETLIGSLDFPGLGMAYYLRQVIIELKVTRAEKIPLLDSFPLLVDLLRACHGPDHGVSCLQLEVNSKTPTGTVLVFPDVLSEKSNPKFSKAFFDLCHSSRLKTLHLTQVGLFSKTLRHTCIEHIYLQQVTFEEDPAGCHVELEKSSILQPASMTLISTRRIQHYPDPAIHNPLVAAPGLEVTNPVDYFLPLTQPHTHIFSSLTSLTVFDRDHCDLQLELLPSLRRLKVVQQLAFQSVSSFGYSKLYLFFRSQLGVARNLGSTKILIVETDIKLLRMFLNDKRGYLKGLRFSRLKSAQECWEDLDILLTSEGATLEQIRFVFNFTLKSQEDLSKLAHTSESFIEENKKLIAAYFPRLSHSSLFSLDVRIKNHDILWGSGVRFISSLGAYDP